MEPAERWHGGSDSSIKGEKMYLSAVPSGAGGAYNNKVFTLALSPNPNPNP